MKFSMRPAEEGETFTFNWFGNQGSATVKAKSEGDKGQWVCIECSVPLQNPMEKDQHCEKPRVRKAVPQPGVKKVKGATHVLAWRSFVSGEIEVP